MPFPFQFGSPTPVIITDQSGSTGTSANLPVVDASTGADNATAPLFATEIGWIDAGGKLQAVSAANPLPTSGGGGGGGNVTIVGPLGQALAAASVPVILPAATVTTLTPPAAITNFANETGGNLAAIKADVDKIPSQGQALAGASMPVVLTAAQITTLTPPSSVTVTQGTGTNLHAVLDASSAVIGHVINDASAAVIGHVIADTGSTTAVTGNVTVVQPTGTNLHVVNDASSAVIGHIIADTGSTTAVTGNVTVVQGTGTNLHVVVDTAPSTAVTNAGTFAVQATLQAGTALIGSVSASDETSILYSGTTALTPAFATISVSATGTLVALVSSKKIRVLSLSLMSSGTVNVKFQSHVSPTDITGLYYLVANTGFVLPYNPLGWFQTVSGEALDINLSAGIAVGGCLVYVAV